ncbi:MAG: cyclase family protein, partial [Candidatus Paceibacterota bacterium]
TRSSESISAADIVSKSIVKGERILAKTKNSQRGFDTFYKDYVYLSPEAAESLAELDIKLFGIDSLSVKQSGGSNIPHTALLNRGIVIFEGLDLSRVDEGRYFLAALPLKLKGLDGAPARVVLLK